MINKIITKSFAVLALVASMAGCSHDIDVYGQAEKEAEFNDQFKNNVLGGQAVDANQTWSTAEKATVSVNVNLDYGKSYKVYVFTANPLLNKEAKYIGMGTVVSGGQLDITVARPADVNSLFAACVDDKGAYTVQQFEMTGDKAEIVIGSQSVASARRAIQRKANVTLNPGQWNTSVLSTNPNDYLKDGQYFINDMLNYNNNWAGYYDLSLVDPSHYDKLSYGIYNELNNGSQPVYGDGKHFIVPAGKSVEGSVFNWQSSGEDHILVVAGTLTINGDCKFDNGKSLVVAAGGRLILNGTKLEITNTSRLMNYGTITINGTYIDFTNYNSKGFYNGGTITGSNGSVMNFAGGWSGNEPLYYNAGRINLGDGAFQFNGVAVLVNAGHMKAATGKKGATQLSELSASAQNGTVYNLCDMDIDMYGVNFYVGCDGSLLHCAKGLMTNYDAKVVLGKQAMIYTKDMYSNGAHYYGVDNSEDYGILKVTGVVDEQNGGNMTAHGYVYFDINSIDGSRDGGWHKTQFVSKMQYTVSEATAPAHVTIPADAEGCNALGYNAEINGGGGGNFTPNYIYYAFEDLGTIGDFDFNDVVIRVSAPVEGQSTVQIVAAGGTLETYVTYGKGENPTRLGAEVHAAMGENTVSKMINTSGVDTEKFANLGTIQLAADADLTQLPLGIQVIGNNGQTIRVTRSVEGNGRAPLVIVVSGNDEGKWFWPTEKTNIVVAYEDFGAWGANVSSNPDWYKNASGSVVSF